MSHYGARVVAHVLSPHGAGRLSSPDGVGTAGSPSCGDQVRIELHVNDGTVTAARFQAFGCPATIAGGLGSGRLRVEDTRSSRPLSSARPSLADALELSTAKRTCSNLAADALHAALEDVIGRGVSLIPPDWRPTPRACWWP